MEEHINDLDAKGYEDGKWAYQGVLKHLRLPKHNIYLVLFHSKFVSSTIKSPLLDILDAGRTNWLRTNQS